MAARLQPIRPALELTLGALVGQSEVRADDRGSKATRCDQPIIIYEPFFAGTHDEKMYRVVKDRERWFGVVMGESSPLDERSTENRSTRVALPPGLARLLTMDLSLEDQRAGR